MSNRFCPQCGTQVAGEDRFCPACGAALKERRASGDPVVVQGGNRSSRRLLSPWILGVIVGAGILMLAGGLLLQQDDTAQEVPPTTAANIPFPNIPRTDLQQAQERVQGSEAIFVDVRSAEDYDVSHIPGAVSIPLGPEALDPAYQDLPVNAELITYCT